MMQFNVTRLLDDYNIEYHTRDKNCSPDFINVCCPFCHDTSWHLGIYITGEYSNCWKCGNHPIKDTLIKILGFNWGEINDLIYEYGDYKILLDNLNKRKNEIKEIELPGRGELTISCIDYLEKRNFSSVYVKRKYNIYDGWYVGDWKYRIVIPVYFKNKIVTFQTRDYTDEQELKYKNLNVEKSIIPIKNILYNLDNCKNNSIGVVEGVFDCWRLGDNFCCSFGTNLTDFQIKLLSQYKNIYFIFDSEELAQEKAKQHAKKLASIGCNVEVINLELDNRDPAELTAKEVRKIKQELNL